ncbi:MAG: glycosyltransferase family 2 protein [Verrucomicrobiota bacterium]
MKTTVLIPFYNESATIEKILSEILLQSLVTEIIMIDDGSTDEGHQKAQLLGKNDSRIKIVRHSKNQGKGAAIRTGLLQATGDFILIQDADLEYNPNEYAALLAPLWNNEADVVYGSRFQGRESHHTPYFFNRIGNKVLTRLSNFRTGLQLTDIQTCFKVFRKEILQKITLCENRFGFDSEITAKTAKTGARILEVSVSYHGRTYAEGKKLLRWKDGWRSLYAILKY